MKITPAKNYKKPLYAIGIAATLMAVSVTGCTDLSFGSKDSDGGSRHINHAGSRKNRTDETEYCKFDADEELVIAGEIELEGVLPFDDPEVELDGDIAVYDPEST